MRTESVIRTASSSDLPFLVTASLQLESLERKNSATALGLASDFPERLREWFASLLDQENALLLVAECEGETAGFCLAFVNAQPNAFTVFKSHGLIQLLWTEEGFRRQGVGAALLDAVESVFRELDIAYVDVYHSASNVLAANYWSAHGYKTDSMLCRKFF